MSLDINRIYKRLLDEAIDGVGLYLVKKVTEYAKPYTVKTLKQYNDPAVKIGLSIIDVFLPQLTSMPYIGDWSALAGREGMKELIEVFVDKPSLCFGEDANTIHCVNFDTTSVIVKIDGAQLQPNTDYTIDGTADDFKIMLTNTLTGGAHDVMIAGDKVSFSGKVYV